MPSKDKIKILRIIARLNIGGPSIHVVNLTHYLSDDRFSSKLIIGKEAPHEGNMLHLAKEKGVEPIMLEALGRELHPLKDLSTLWKLYRIIRNERPDIVHTHTAKAGTLGRIAAKLAGVPIIIHTFHGHIFHSYFGKLKTRIFLLIEQVLALFTTKIIAISEKQKEELVALGVAPEKKFTVIPLGFELEKFVNVPRTGELRKTWGIAQDEKVIGIIGRLVPVKNHAALIPIMQDVLRTYGPKIKLAIIGKGELEGTLQEQFRAAGLERNVVFAGWHHELEKVYPELDIVVLTSLNEGTPVALIEAMACGVPVISTEIGGVADIVKDGEWGFLVPRGDHAAFADRIVTLLSDRPLCEQFVQKGRAFAFKTFSVTRLVSDIRALYDRLITAR